MHIAIAFSYYDYGLYMSTYLRNNVSPRYTRTVINTMECSFQKCQVGDTGPGCFYDYNVISYIVIS